MVQSYSKLCVRKKWSSDLNSAFPSLSSDCLPLNQYHYISMKLIPTTKGRSEYKTNAQPIWDLILRSKFYFTIKWKLSRIEILDNWNDKTFGTAAPHFVFPQNYKWLIQESKFRNILSSFMFHLPPLFSFSMKAILRTSVYFTTKLASGLLAFTAWAVRKCTHSPPVFSFAVHYHTEQR